MVRKLRHTWVSISEARRILVASREAVQHLIDERRITVRRLPNSFPLLLRADVERIAAESVTPALSQGA